ncbi:hypothetical protein GAR06_02208 [Micromonospora saelicesensis]|nr:hypothetical protein GAR06_02208 [Micromonospora saelicesensis]
MQQRVGAERAAVAVAQPGVALLLPGHRGGDVALAVTGAGEHQRQRHQRPVPPGDERADRVGQRWAGQLDEAALDVADVAATADPLDESGELLDPGRAARTVPDDDQPGHDFSST